MKYFDFDMAIGRVVQIRRGSKTFHAVRDAKTGTVYCVEEAYPRDSIVSFDADNVALDSEFVGCVKGAHIISVDTPKKVIRVSKKLDPVFY